MWRKKNIFTLNFVLVTDGEDEPEGVRVRGKILVTFAKVRVRVKDFGHN